LVFVVREVYDVSPSHIDETITCETSLKLAVPLLGSIDVGISQRKLSGNINMWSKIGGSIDFRPFHKYFLQNASRLLPLLM
jgi:hypothetical protein